MGNGSDIWRMMTKDESHIKSPRNSSLAVPSLILLRHIATRRTKHSSTRPLVTSDNNNSTLPYQAERAAPLHATPSERTACLARPSARTCTAACCVSSAALLPLASVQNQWQKALEDGQGGAQHEGRRETAKERRRRKTTRRRNGARCARQSNPRRPC